MSALVPVVCGRCTNEVLVAAGYEGPAPLCEFCSGRTTGFHEQMDRLRRRRELQRRIQTERKS